MRGALPSKALQLTSHSAFRSWLDYLLALNSSGSAVFGGAVGRS
jgi:hypothetical protein